MTRRTPLVFLLLLIVLTVQPLSTRAAELRLSDGAVVVEDGEAFDDGGDDSSCVTVYRSTDTTSFQQIEPASYSDTELAAFTGRYHSDELDVDYQVRGSDEMLQLVPSDRNPLMLSPGAADAFQIRGEHVQFERSSDGTVTGFVYNTRRVAGLRFDRRR